MNNSYTTIQTLQTAEWNRERAIIISEQFRPWGEYFLLVNFSLDHCFRYD